MTEKEEAPAGCIAIALIVAVPPMLVCYVLGFLVAACKGAYYRGMEDA